MWELRQRKARRALSCPECLLLAGHCSGCFVCTDCTYLLSTKEKVEMAQPQRVGGPFVFPAVNKLVLCGGGVIL